MVYRALYSDYYIKAGLLMVDSGVKLGDLVDAGGEDDSIYHGIEKCEVWETRFRLCSGCMGTFLDIGGAIQAYHMAHDSFQRRGCLLCKHYILHPNYSCYMLQAS